MTPDAAVAPNMARIFSRLLIEVLARVKRRELKKSAAIDPARLAPETHQAV